MGRPRAFDVDTALDAAVELFWTRGYGETSLDDLVDHLGVSRPGIYRVWGSKEALYRAALARYQELNGRHFLERLAATPDRAREIIRDRLVEICDLAISDHVPAGCMIVHAIGERSQHDPAVRDDVAAALEALEDAIFAALLHASDAPTSGHQPRAVARYLVVVIEGLRVVGNVRPSRDVLSDAVDVALEAVWP
jgi:TetR/AcrR family transcriptional regulator, transcriptional repressor for nem operon